MGKIHATTVEIDGVGVMIVGAPGTGKSDLALRLIDDGAHLVADDYTEISATDGRIMASAPPNTVGLLEVRGLGVYRVPSSAVTEVRLVVALAPMDKIERLPDERTVDLHGVAVPEVTIDAHESAAVAKVRLAAKQIAGDIRRVT